MIATWMLYALALALAVSGVTLAAEYGLRLYGRSTRWLWATSLVAALALPLLAWVLTAPPAPVPANAIGQMLPVAGAAPVAPVRAAPVDVSLWSRARALEGRLDGDLPWLWLGLSVLAGLGLALSYVRLRRQRRAWAEGEVDGVPVLVSDGTGPAVVGLRRGRIVVPSWVLAEPEARRRLILAHEAEHLAAGDARLLTGALAALVAAPWNPLVWWQIRRLRLAAEVDCDARVLRRGADLRGYAGLLLDVGMRFGEGGALAAFAEPRSLLARRLRALTAPLPRRRGWRVAVVALTGAGVAALACVAPRPDKPLPTEPIGPVQAVAADTPSVTPYTVAPELTNREEVRRLLIEAYPPLLKQAGIGGRILVWEHVDREGQVTTARVDQSSGQPPLDSAAVYVGRQMKFTPARNGAAPVAVWIKLPIVFMTSDGPLATSAPDSVSARLMGQTRRVVAGPPAADSFDVAPELLNAPQVQAAARQFAVANGGMAVLRLYIDETGRVTQTGLVRSSGVAAQDQALMSAARLMRFTAAQRAGRPVGILYDVALNGQVLALGASIRPSPANPAPPAATSLPSAAQRDTFDVPPKLLNIAEANAGVNPAQWESLHVSDVVLGVLIDETGQVKDVRVRHSVSAAADSIAIATIRRGRYSPALLRGKPVAAWVQAGRQTRAAPTSDPIRQGPTFTPYTVAPELSNREEVRPALAREYPPELKAAGVGGTVQIWLLLDQSGTPIDVRVKNGSGQPALDSAAVRVGRMMRFTAAKNLDVPVEIWVALPIMFKTTPSGAPAARPDTQRSAQAPNPRTRTTGIAAAAVTAATVAVMHR